MLKQNERLEIFTVAVVALLVMSMFLPASAQLSQWRSLNPTRDGTIPPNGIGPNLYSVQLFSPSIGWAVGGTCDIYKQILEFCPGDHLGKGFALYWDGTRWHEVLTPPGTGTLTSVFGSSPNDVWAVGLGPTVIHWDGTSWVSVSAAVKALGVQDLFSVFMLPGGIDGWAVGDGDGGATSTDNIRWSGIWPTGAWTKGTLTNPDLLAGSGELRAVSLSSPTYGWIVGTGGHIFRWDGLGWNSETSPVSTELLSVFAISGSDAWAAGRGDTIIRWNGASWTGPMIAPTSGVDYHSIKMVSATDGWIAGILAETSMEGTLLRWNGVAWAITRSFVMVDLNGLSLLPGGTVGAAVGNAETIIHWDGTQWNAETSPTAFDLNDVFLTATDDGWAVGDGGNIYRWNGQSWHHYETLPSGEDLRGVFMTASSDAWAVGASPSPSFPPTILRWNGASWTVKSPPGVAVGQTLNDVHMLSANEGWAVGGTMPILVSVSGSSGVLGIASAPDPVLSIYASGFKLSAVNPASVVTSDSSGTAQHVFLLSSDVYATVTASTGSGSKDVTIYVLSSIPPSGFDLDGPPSEDVSSDGANSVTIPAMGTFSFKIWSNPLTPGSYYVVVDVNQNGVYDGKGDLIDETAFTVSAKVAPNLSTTVEPLPVDPGSEVHDTAAFSGLVSGVPPTGKVTYSFWKNGACDGTADSTEVVDIDADGMVPDSAPHAVTAGSYSFQAHYGGDHNYYAADSSCESFTVGGASTTTSITVTDETTLQTVPPGSVSPGDTVHAFATVFGTPGGLDPTGQVTYYFYSTSGCTGGADDTETVSVGSPSPSYGPLAVGSYSFKAVYHGDDNYASSESVCSSFTVSAAGVVCPSAVTLKWDGTLWTSVPSGTQACDSLNSVFMLSSNDGWAVGTDAAGTGPVIVRWNGLAWSPVTAPVGIGGLNSVYFVNPNDGWAVGDRVGTLPDGAGGQVTIIHWDGIQWRRVPGPSINPLGFLDSVFMVSATDGWAVGFDPQGVAFAAAQSSAVEANIVAADQDLSLIVHWDGLTWNVVATLPLPPTMAVPLRSVFMVEALDGWIVADEGLILKYGPEVVPATSTSTSIVTETSTTTNVTTTSTITCVTCTVPPGPGIPGFPTESILAGLVTGVAMLAVLRHRPRRRH